MNPELMLETIAQRINTRKPTKTGTYYIGFTSGTIDCVPTDVKPKPWPVLAKVNENDCQCGLPIAMWNHIKRRIVLLFELEPVKCKHQKP